MKWLGNVGYAVTEENPVGSSVYVETIIPHAYILEDRSQGIRVSDGTGINKNIVVTNQISFVADQYAFEHYSAIKYVEYMNTKWEVATISVERPRLVLTLGEVYNG